MLPTMDFRFAVLNDADNVPSDRLKEMMEKVAKYDTPTFKAFTAIGLIRI